MGRAPGLRFGAACVAVAALAVVVPAAGAPEDRPPPPKGPPLLEDESSSRHEGRQPPAPPVTPPKPEPSPLFAAGPLDDTIEHPASPRGRPATGSAQAPSPAPTAAPRKGTTGPLAPVSPDFVPGQVLVRFRGGVGADARAAVLSRHRAAVARELRIPGLVLARLPSGRSVRAAAAALSGERDVLYAEPNFIYRASLVPDDTFFPSLWGLNQASDADIDAPEAWDTTTGSSAVVVAVADTGVADDHPDLAPNIWENAAEAAGTAGVDDDTNGFVDDIHGWDWIESDGAPRDLNGHGTHVAGTIGAQGNDTFGVAGVAWAVSLMPLRVLDADGFGSTADITDAFTYAGANGADVVNASLGGGGFSQAMKDAIDGAPGTLFVLAAGNDGTNNDTTPTYPCSYTSSNIVCVAATNSVDGLAGFSNYGATSVDLAAPGVGVLSDQPKYKAPLWTHGFEVAGGWTSGGTGIAWDRTSTAAATGTFSNTDSPGGNYAINSNSWSRRDASFSLAGETDCKLFYELRLETELNFDFLLIDAATSSTGPWTTIGGWHGSTNGAFFDLSTDLSPFVGEPTVFVRFRLDSDFINNFDGAYVDDVRVRCLGGTYTGAADEFDMFSGTSMATPHVAGAAADVLARAAALGISLSVSQLKTILLESVDPLASLAGLTPVVTGGRLNLFKAVSGFCAGSPATLIGTDGNNVVAGTAGNDVVVTFAGHDQITGNAGDDRICAGGGNDLVHGNAGADVLQGGNGDDALNGGTEDDNLDGGAGNDTLRGMLGNDTFAGGPGAGDWVVFLEAPGAVNANLLTGAATGQGTDTLSGIEALQGSAFNDTLIGDGQNNALRGEGGTDTLIGNGGDDSLFGGAGDDNATLDGGTGNDYLSGGDGVDKLLGGAGNDFLFGDGGDDGGTTGLLDGGDGNDYVWGGGGADKLVGGADFDFLSGEAGIDELDGGPGHDHLNGGADNDSLTGGTGNDWVNYEFAAGPVTVDLSASPGTGSGAGVGTDTLVTVELVVGSAFDDSITGNSVGNILRGGPGNDSLTGNDGEDILVGGPGDDISTLDGGPGHDVLFGGDGTDKLLGGTGNDQLFGGPGDDGGTTGLLDGGDGNDQIFGGPGADKLVGGADDDALNGGSENDLLDGGLGHDTLRGGPDNDLLNGDLGNDWGAFSEAAAAVSVDLGAGTASGEGSDTLSGIEHLVGSAFGDTLKGDAGTNVFLGEAGADTFLTSPSDDVYVGGDGTDTLSFAAAPGPIQASLLAGGATGDGDDGIFLIENLIGSGFADFLEGDNVTNEISGLGDDDHIFGLDAPDVLDGGPGFDLLNGGPPTPPAAGVDTCIAGEVLLDCEA